MQRVRTDRRLVPRWVSRRAAGGVPDLVEAAAAFLASPARSGWPSGFPFVAVTVGPDGEAEWQGVLGGGNGEAGFVLLDARAMDRLNNAVQTRLFDVKALVMPSSLWLAFDRGGRELVPRPMRIAAGSTQGVAVRRHELAALAAAARALSRVRRRHRSAEGEAPLGGDRVHAWVALPTARLVRGQECRPLLHSLRLD